jgi:plastocyanin
MKKILLICLFVSVVTIMNAQTTFNINKGVGNSFDPLTLTVTQGDIIHFNLTSFHSPLQVSLDTWNANGVTPLPGGFSFPNGSGDFTTTTPGTIYYVCTQHVALDGMKGTITVNAITAINDIYKDGGGKLFPNPARDFITYQAKTISRIKEIRIVDLTGRAVKVMQKPELSESQIRIEISNLDRGMYFIIVKSDDGIESGRFLKS